MKLVTYLVSAKLNILLTKLLAVKALQGELYKQFLQVSLNGYIFVVYRSNA
jgi:hypothetical protein